jgi:hypothetical protein
LPIFVMFLARAAGFYLSALGWIPQPTPGLLRPKENNHREVVGIIGASDSLGAGPTIGGRSITVAGMAGVSVVGARWWEAAPKAG